MTRLTLRSTLFPYTTLFRSKAALSGESQADDLFAHGWFAVATRFVRLQTEAAGVEWEGLPGIALQEGALRVQDRKSTRLNSSHTVISYAVFCLKKKKRGTEY